LSRRISIDSSEISDDSDCYVIAELGHNHQGQVDTAKALIKAAHDCGVNAVKFQKRDNRSLYTRAMFDKPYENENSFGPTYGQHREALEFGWAEYQELQAYARALGLTLFATAFDFPSADFLAKLGVPAFKLASGDLTNIPLLKYVAGFGRPMIVSTGGGSLAAVERAYEAIMPLNTQICLLQCTASYPAAFEELNLRVITTYRERFPEAVVGLSAHDNGIAMALVGYVLGARVVEKHFTLNRSMKGTDHAFSLEHSGMRRMVRDLQRARVAMGDGLKRQYPSEVAPLQKMGKKLVAARDLPAGHLLAREDIAIKSPNDGLPPYELEKFLGRRLGRALSEDESLSFDVIAPDGQA
jgi:N-acetylneuraminate synthase/sialic acid synthase